MGATTVYVRCPNCGGEIRATLAPGPPTQWFPCPHCRAPVPVVAPRDPPPLYTWEVMPGLYPALPSPRLPRRRSGRPIAVTLIAIAVVAAALAGVLAYDGWLAVQPASFAVAGTVEHAENGLLVPIAGATVRLTNDANQSTSLTTGLNGGFAFAGVPPGGVSLNVSAVGFSPVTVTTFVSSVYAAPATGLMVELSPGGANNGTAVALAAFPDLEQFEAALGSGAVLLAIVTVVAGAAAVATDRDERPALSVVGGAAGILSPFVLFYLSLSNVFPLLTLATAALAGAGTVVVGVRAARLAETGPAAD
ncbi:MAG TPA: carboxypeptidase-like regulatory domain-containing protein [Thermoplasmata archaeon]|nr:carboxypeptidase-like regulatory domain-containing protein [Thermoplasmata archaeon]